VPTFHPTELVATKIRALHQRRKGRDLFDLWLALTQMNLDPREIVEAFAPYRPAGLTSAVLQRNLRAKQQDAEFRSDIDLLIAAVPHGYTVDAAAELVIAEIAPLL
jgi:predicted nucleotidyltransferase component of viral defense system